MTALSAPAWYVYAVVPEGVPVPHCDESILPGAELVLCTAAAPLAGGASAGLAALASLVPRTPFEMERGAGHAADPDWVAARAAAHHAVVSRLTGLCPFLPLGFGTLFSSAESLRQWLTDHEIRLRRAMEEVAGRVEWSVLLAEDVAAHAAWVVGQDAEIRAIAAASAAAGPGTAFLLQRRLARAQDLARAAHCRAMASGIVAGLTARGMRVQAEPRAHGMAWSALADDGDDVAETLQPIADACADTGLDLHVTGPWPPYGFARAAFQERQDA